MNRATEVTEELESMGSILAVLSRAMPYSVPAGYFDQWFNFAHPDVNLIPGDFSATTNDIGFAQPGVAGDKVMPYNVPDGYFEGFASNIIAAAKAGSIYQPDNLNRQMPNSVPAGYFDSLPGKMLQAAKYASSVKKKTTIIPLGRDSFRQVRWAAAAVLLVCIGLGGYVSFFSGNGHQNGTETMLASVPNEEIQDYLQHTYILDVNRIVNNNDINKIQVDNSDIVQYLNETGWDVVD